LTSTDRPLTSGQPAPGPGTPSRGGDENPASLTGFARLERFWTAHSDAIFRAAYRITGNPADAEDVLQTVFLRLARQVGSGGVGREGAEVDAGELREHEAGGYLYRSAVNAALDIVRSRQRAGWVPLEPTTVGTGPAAGHEIHASSATDPERQQRNRELRANLRLAIARLSPRSAEIFALRYFEDLSNREIASLMGISQGLVAVLLHRTRARLRKELVTLEGVVR
jgi:RNA polymerase sigma-70 factor (ECF subfamily)